IAISGKGGVGKTTLAALLAHVFAQAGRPVVAIDADPAANLAWALGIPPELQSQLEPIAGMADLIEERTGARPGVPGAFFRLNPQVNDLPERFSVVHRGIRLLQLGTVKHGGQGCFCAEHALLRALVSHLLLRRDEVVIMDMEAGVEHLTRGTAQGVDAFVVVVEPGRRSLVTAGAIAGLATDLGLQQICLVGNKVRGEEDRAFIVAHAPPDAPVIGYLPADPAVVEADMRGVAVFDAARGLVEEAQAMAAILEGLAAT
ncbi:MAG: carbon monoxide dehydrogenase, partial [Chloroflexi bacterium]